MAPNSRPPLTSRIRASFEGRRKSFEGTRRLSKSGRGTTADSNGNGASQEIRSATALSSEVNSPLHTNGFITQDPESIRNAVDQAINGEAFQTAIAANLAKLIKPSIKSALDTIQPVVEAVYAHEMLLRKTNQSVEDVLSRMDTNAESAAAARRESFVDSTYIAPGSPADGEKSADAVEVAVNPREISGLDLDQFRELMGERDAKTLATISESIESNTTKISDLTQVVSELNSSAGTTKESLQSLKSASEQANTTSSVLQAQLDQLKLDIGQIIEAIGADLGKNIQAISEKSGAPDAGLLSLHTTKLDLISTDLAALKGHADTVEKIGALSSDIGALRASVEAGNASNAEGFTNVLAVAGEHSTTLNEVKEKAPHPEIVAALQQSNDSHALHSTTLSEIKERSMGLAPVPVVSGGNVDPSSAFVQIQSDITALKENIAAGLATNNDLGTKLDTVLTTIEEYKAGDSGAEILCAVKQSNESHAAHATALEGLKSNSTDNNPELGAQITGVVGKLDEHTAVLEEIKAVGGAHTEALVGIKSDASELVAQITAIIAKLDTHTEVLDEIKGFTYAKPESTPVDTGNLTAQIGAITTKLDAHAVTLDEIKGLSGAHATALEGHGAALESIKPVVSEAATVDTGDIATQISAINSKLDSHTAALEEIKGIGGSHATALEGIQSINLESVPASDTSDLNNHITAIASKLEEHTSTLDELKGLGGSHAAALATHGTALEGIKSLSVTPPAEVNNRDLDGQVAAIITTLDSHGAALDQIKSIGGGHTSVLDEIRTFGATHATALDSHGAMIEDIKARAVESKSASDRSIGFETHITELAAKLDSHSTVLEEIKLASTSHADVLEGIKSPEIPTAPAVDPMNLAALEIQIGSIISTLETHSAAWNEIKARHDPASTAVVSTDAGSDSGTAEGPFATIIETLMLHTNLLNEIKEDVAAEILTALHDMGQTQANQTNLLTEIREADLDDEILTLLHASSESHASHTTALDKIHSAVLVSIDSHTAHATSLEEIKSRSVESAAPPGDSPDLDDLKEKVSGISQKLVEYGATLSAIRDATAASNESHAAHATSLEDIKSRSVEAAPAEDSKLATLEAQIGGLVAKLDDQSACLSAIKDATSVSNQSHAAHNEALMEIKDKSSSSLNLHSAHATILGEIKNLHSSHAASLSELQKAASGFNDNHAATLSEVKEITLASKDAHASHTAALSQLKSMQTSASAATESNNFSTVETQINSILSTLEAQTATLLAIKEGTAVANPEIIAAIQASHDLLTSHGSLLESIKEGILHADILANISELKSIVEDSKADVATHGALVKDLHAEIKDGHSNLASAIGALALGSAAGAGATAVLSKDEGESSSAVLDEVKAVRAIIETSAANVEATNEKVASLVSQIGINHTTITTSISTLGDELKAEIDASGTGIVDSITRLDGDVKSINVSPLSTLIEQQSADIKDLSAVLGTLDGNVKENNTHFLTLHSGVHLNDTGINQLKDHIALNSMSAPSGDERKDVPITEGAWFGSARSGSRSPTLSRVTSRNFVDPIPATQDQNKEIDDVVDTPKIEETTEAAIMSEEPAVVDGNIVEREHSDSGEDTPEGVLSPIAEDKIGEEPEPAIPDKPELKDTLGTIPDVGKREAGEAELSTEIQATVDLPVEDAQAVSGFAEDAKDLTEDPSHEAEQMAKDGEETKNIVAEEGPPEEKERDEPTVEEPVVFESQSETDPPPIKEVDKTVTEPAIKEPPTVGSPLDSAGAEDLEVPDKEVDKSISQQPQVVDDRQNSDDSLSIDEPIATSTNVELPEGIIVHERELQSGDDSAISGPPSELDRGHEATMLEDAEDRSTPRMTEPLASDLKSDGQTSRSVSRIAEANEILDSDSPSSLSGSAAIMLSDVPGNNGVILDSDACWPLPTHEFSQSSSLFIDSPNITRDFDESLVNMPQEQTPLPPSPQQNLLADQGLDSGHATPLDYSRSNPFEDSDTLQSPAPVLSPTSEDGAPKFPIRDRMESTDEGGLRSPESDFAAASPAFPVFPGIAQHSSQQRFEDSDDVMSPSSEYDAPVLAEMRHRTAVQNQQSDSPEKEPAPSFPVFPGTSQYSTQQRFDDSDDGISPVTGYDAYGLPHMTQESPFQSRQPDTSYDPSSPQYERDPTFPTRALHHESSFYYPQENYEPAMLPRGLAGQLPAEAYEVDDFRSPYDSEAPLQELGRRSPLQPLDDDDYRAGQYERYSPEPVSPASRQGSLIDSPCFKDSHLQLDPSFPAVRQRSPIQPFEDEYSSPRQQRYSPEPESSPFIQRQYSPETAPLRQSAPPPHLQLDTPAFRSTSPIDPYSERESEIVSPSSEFAVPITPGMSAKPTYTPPQEDTLRSPASEVDEPSFQAQSYKGKATASPGPLTPDLGSPAEFGFSREETETEPDSGLASPTSPTSPAFSEGGTMVEKSAGGKKKKGKKDKKGAGGGGKKGKKERVPFEMEGEDAE